MPSPSATSKIPLPKSRSLKASSSLDDTAAPASPSRIPLPTGHQSPRRKSSVPSGPPAPPPGSGESIKRLGKENVEQLLQAGGEGPAAPPNGGGKQGKWSAESGSATFVRRLSPPASGVMRHDSYENVHEDRSSERALSEGPISPRKSSITSTSSPSRIPSLNDYPRSSSGSGDSSRNSPARNISPPDRPSVDAAKPIRDHLQLDLGSRIPLPRTANGRRVSPPKTAMPTVGFSFSPERMINHHEVRRASTSNLWPQPSQKPGEDVSQKRRKTFEAFVMTGDRMINLAKTPANAEFKSKYQKSISDSHLRPLTRLDEPNSGDEPGLPLADVLEDLPDPVGRAGVDEPVKRRAQPAARRALVRTSKSEDQLNLEESPSSPPDEHFGSVNALMDTSAAMAALDETTWMQSELEERPSPPVDTNSLISDSEHYDAESVLAERISPKSSTSPDTPEWSLLDSFHKKNGQASGGGCPLASFDRQDSMEESITSKGHTVIISIGDKHPPLSSPTTPIQESPSVPGLASGSSSNGTITPDVAARQPQNGSEPVITAVSPKTPISPSSPGSPPGDLTGELGTGQMSQSILTNSSEEDSDLDSLHSYHPPQRIIDTQSAARLAKRLYHLDGFKKTDVSRHLSRNTDYNRVVAEEYLKFFEFEHSSLDVALRQFLGHFCLTGETQERERVLFHFSKRFLECNPDVLGVYFKSQDAVHTLTCAIMLLNTDLHGDNMQRKMTCPEFVDNLCDLNDGTNFPRELLRGIYVSIKERPIPWTLAEELSIFAPGLHSSTGGVARGNLPPEVGGPSEVILADPKEVSIGSGVGGYNPFLSLPDPNSATDYKTGYVMRKSCFDANGKRTKLGKRSWKMFFLTLKDMVLYCFKDEKVVRNPGSFEDFNCAIRVHHGLAVRAHDYTKKQFVFRLYTADQAQYLFQTSDEKELLTWIEVINYVVASFSAPQLPAPCSSGGRFQRPLLPSSKTKLTPKKQLESHEAQLDQLKRDLEVHLQTPPPKASKQSTMSAYREKVEYLRSEVMRYDTYILTLKTKNGR